MLVLEGNLSDARFPTLCNVFVGNSIVLLLQEELACARFLSWLNVVGNLVMSFYQEES